MIYQGIAIVPTINYSNATPGAGSYEALKIAVTETALPTGQSYLARMTAGVAAANEIFSVTNRGNVAVGHVDGQSFGIKMLTELTTIAAAATTDTTIAIPINAIVLAVSVRTTVVIPVAATYTVIGTTSSTAST